MRPGLKRWLLCGSVLFAGALAVRVWVSSPVEPKYQGRSLSFWVEQYVRGQNAPRNAGFMGVVGALPLRSPQKVAPQAEEAIRAIGPKAWPHLVQWITYEKSSARARFESTGLNLRARLGLQRLIPSSIFWDRKEIRKLYAYEVFVMLGADAATAVPFLTRALPHCGQTSTMRDLILLARTTGHTGTKPLLEFLTNPRTDAAQGLVGEARCEIIRAFSSAGTNDSQILAALTDCVSDKDARVALAVSKVLARLSLHCERVVPALARLLNSPDAEVRRTAAEHLACYFDKATMAIPRLRPLLKDTDAGVRTAAEIAIQCISPEDVSEDDPQDERSHRPPEGAA